MKKTLTAVFLLSLLAIACGKKEDPYPCSSNEVKASVSEKGGAYFSFDAKNTNHTNFSKTVHSSGDVSIIIDGDFDLNSEIRYLNLNLYNITATGTYEMGGSGNQFVQGTYDIGPILNSQESFSVQPPASSGTITITELTDNTIKGSFNMTCIGSTGTVQVNNGSFNGIFVCF